MSRYGFMVVGGLRLPIIDVRFAGGRLVVTAEVAALDGPVKRAVGPVTIFGADGVGVCQGSEVLTIEPCASPTVYTVEYSLGVDQITPAQESAREVRS